LDLPSIKIKNMAEETQYRAKTGITQINTANTNTDGTGTISNIIKGTQNGVMVKNIFIKALSSTTNGMVRIFVQNDLRTVIQLLYEIEIPAITQAAIRPTFEATVPINFTLQNGYTLMASTQNAESFNIIAEGMEWSYYTSAVRQDTTKLYPKFESATVQTANSNLNGTGVIEIVYTAGATPTYKGSSINTINIKSAVNVNPGMIRLYINDTNNSYLFKEIIVPTLNYSGTDKTFNHTLNFEDDLDIQAGYSICASTQLSEQSNVFAEGNDWNYYS